jgi:hypothetical protein
VLSGLDTLSANVCRFCAGEVVEQVDPPDKEYTVVSANGTRLVVPLTSMVRRSVELTRAELKAWVHSVARQQSLGVRGMSCVWLVHDDLLAMHNVQAKVPEHIEAQLAKGAKRRQARQRAKERSREQVACAAPRTQMLQAQHGHVQGSGVGFAEGAAAAAVLGATAAAMQVHIRSPAAHSAEPPHESLEASEAKLEVGSLKAAIFQVLKDAGSDGLSVNDIMSAVKVLGFDWQDCQRVGKSSIASTCSHDAIFLRLAPGIFTLRALPGALQRLSAIGACSRETLDVWSHACSIYISVVPCLLVA